MTQTKRLRRPPDGGYARGDETRVRIIEAAVKLFGEHGFDGASTRDIAAAAEVNAPALQYYFENKQGLYQACAEHIISEVLAWIEPAMKKAAAALRGDDELALIDGFIAIQEATLDCMLLQPQASNRRLFVIRELAGEEPKMASKLLQRRLKQPMNKLCLELLARISGVKAEEPLTRIRLLTVRGQAMPFHHYQAGACDLIGWKKIDKAKADLLKRTILGQTRTLLENWRVAPVKATATHAIRKATRTAPP